MSRENHKRSGQIKLKCPKCHQDQMARIARHGFLRNHIYPLLGLYPWQCAICGTQRLLRQRRAGYRRVGPTGENPPSGAESTHSVHAR